MKRDQYTVLDSVGSSTEPERPSQPTLVSIVILNYNGGRILERCLASVFKSLYTPIEVFLVDNGSTDDSIQSVRARYAGEPRLTIVELGRNLGFAKGNNVGFKESHGEFVIFLNNDTEVKSDWISPLVRTMTSDLSVGICQSKLLVMDTDNIIDCTGGILYSLGYAAERGSGEIDTGQYDSLLDISYAKGASLCVRRSVFNYIGGFDENFFLRSEEADLCWRTWKSDFRVVLVPRSVVFHMRAASMPIDSMNAFYFSSRNRAYLLFTNYELLNLTKYLPHLYLVELYFFLKMVRFGRREHALAIIRGNLWFLRNLREATRVRFQKESIRHVTDGELFGRVIHRTDFMTFLMSSVPLKFGVRTLPSGELSRNG